MSEYPLIILDCPIEWRAAINTDRFRVLHVAEELESQSVTAFIECPTENIWITIMTAENYDPEWSDETVVHAVQAWMMSNYPPAKSI